MSYAPGERWNLESLFPGGPTSPGFAEHVEALATRLEALVATLQQLGPLESDLDRWRTTLEQWLALSVELGDANGLVYCYNSAHTDDPQGRRLVGRIGDLDGRIAAGDVVIDAAIGPASDATLEALTTGALAAWRPAFERTRRKHALQLEPALQALLAEADREALHGWGQLYDTVVGSLTGTLELDGQSEVLGVAQLLSLRPHPDAAKRSAAFQAVQDAYTSIEDVCAACLTAITGTRQMRLDRVGAGPLANTLLDNRIDQGVLDAMWQGTTDVLPDLVRYFDHKAALLKAAGDSDTDKLRWSDLNAPVGQMPGSSELSWSEAQDLIVDSFASFEPDLASFASDLLAQGGVEAEQRANKRPGGYCAGFDQARTSRIFMTFGGTVMEAVILAHELGHAWHNHILYRNPPAHRLITMSLAETASTFAESIVRDRIDDQATAPRARMAILDQKLQAASGFLMNIRARYDFELSLYELRRQGPFSAAQLTETMTGLLQRSYHHALEDVDPTFWASKLHFYISHFGFYNWPYTFGYLFSQAVYERARTEGPSFRPRVVDLLVRTGWQDSVPLAMQTLGVDLHDPRFWAQAAAPIRGLVDEFVTLK